MEVKQGKHEAYLVICETCMFREEAHRKWYCKLAGKECYVPVENINDTCVNHEPRKGKRYEPTEED